MSKLRRSNEAQGQSEEKMENSVVLLVGMAAFAVVVLAAFVLYRRQQRKRVRQVEGQVREYLVTRYGRLPNHLNINCSEDPQWPVLVSFHSATGTRHRLQFNSYGPASAFSLFSEKEEGS